MDARARQLELLEAEARYHRERYDLYRARSYGPRPTRLARMHELQRASEGAELRLRRARAGESLPPGTPNRRP